MLKKNKLSVCIISLNEESCLEACLKSVLWADEIILLDSGSTDRTLEIAKKYTDKIFSSVSWPGFGKQRQKAESFATHDWILAIDCDEVISEDLKNNILNALNSEQLSVETVLVVNRLTHFMGRYIKHSNWHPDFISRIYNKTHTSYNSDLVHEKIKTNQSVSIKTEGLLFHYNRDSWDEYKNKLSRYAMISAQIKKNSGLKSNILDTSLRPIFAFLRHYILKLGFLDGKAGFFIALAQVNYTYQKYKKLSQLNL